MNLLGLAPDGGCLAADVTTGTGGLCRLARKNDISRTSMTMTVTDIVHAKLTYEPNDNTDADGDSDGTTIIINKPS